ncbi:hypothetical protein PoB_006972600 [Plakobranchus ocellatus]|uniref:Apple domain-containing protein n=1 Tax=Plakobranchus ocellatus TaxID=259542 RepID=A0AAV4DGC4_9GAST|nr:hypothetical protein PoB_006972600 [Plakobranchus ocellatus]
MSFPDKVPDDDDDRQTEEGGATAFQEAQGSTYHSTAPTNVTSSHFVSRADSYLQCVLLCGRENLCRAAHFDLVKRNCEILGPGSFSVSDFQIESASTTFVRKSFGESDIS